MDMDNYLRFMLALVFVLGLLFALAYVMKRFAAPGMVRNRSAKRIKVLEALAVDPKRRLVLVRRDDVEHLLLVGGDSDLVVEGGIPAREEDPDQGAGTPFARMLKGARPAAKDPNPGSDGEIRP
ncbi:MAG: flagellar biosynthetic protein FliO [Rhodospirillum sp.]|nr:flagellar biosynthetic protein FliO [Rhodospirillum sp.]MCF8490025.1 flagellar biosynthetic protein FliO [Rhodospirillum sp.]MCF8499570.1 flagellar biosynthetic protein FliO [Rhodospirillum sp.]